MMDLYQPIPFFNIENVNATISFAAEEESIPDVVVSVLTDVLNLLNNKPISSRYDLSELREVYKRLVKMHDTEQYINRQFIKSVRLLYCLVAISDIAKYIKEMEGFA